MDNSPPQGELAKIEPLFAHLRERSDNRWFPLITQQLVRLYARLADVLEASDQAAYYLEKLSREPVISNPGLLYFPLSALEKELLMVMEADEEILNLGNILHQMTRENPALKDLLEGLSIEARDWTIRLTTDLLGKPNANRWPALIQDMQVLSRDSQTDPGSFSIRLPIEVERATSDVKLIIVDFGEADYRDHLDRSIQYFTGRKQLARIRSGRGIIQQVILLHTTGEKILNSLTPRTKIRSLI